MSFRRRGSASAFKDRQGSFSGFRALPLSSASPAGGLLSSQPSFRRKMSSTHREEATTQEDPLGNNSDSNCSTPPAVALLHHRDANCPEYIRQQEEVLRNISRHFLEPMKIKAQLQNHLIGIRKSQSADNTSLKAAEQGKPTLAALTRFHRLTRVASVLEDILWLEKSFEQWQITTMVDVSHKKDISEQMHYVKKISEQMQHNWMSVKVKMTAHLCLTDGHHMEVKISELHLHVEQLLHHLANIALTSVHWPGGGTGPGDRNMNPLTAAAVADLEISLPIKYPAYFELTKQSIKETK